MITKKRVNFSLDKEMLKKFNEYCKKNGYKKSTLVEKLMKDLLNKESK